MPPDEGLDSLIGKGRRENIQMSNYGKGVYLFSSTRSAAFSSVSNHNPFSGYFSILLMC